MFLSDTWEIKEIWNQNYQCHLFALDYKFQEDRDIVLFKVLSWYLAHQRHLRNVEWMKEWILEYYIIQNTSQNY